MKTPTRVLTANLTVLTKIYTKVCSVSFHMFTCSVFAQMKTIGVTVRKESPPCLLLEKELLPEVGHSPKQMSASLFSGFLEEVSGRSPEALTE